MMPPCPEKGASSIMRGPAGGTGRDGRRLMVLAISFAVLFAMLLAVPGAVPALTASGATGQDELQSLNRQLEQTRSKDRVLDLELKKLLQEIGRLRTESIAVANDAQEHETLLDNLEGEVAGLERNLAAAQTQLHIQYRRIGGILTALTRLSENPPQAVFLQPGEPLDTVRSAMLLRVAVPAVEDQARDLRRDIDALVHVRRDLGDKMDQLAAAEARLSERQARLESLLAEKKRLSQDKTERSRTLKREIDDLVRKSATLKELIAGLDAVDKAGSGDAADAASNGGPLPEYARPQELRRFPVDGVIPAPVRGRLVHRYGDSTGFGQTARGITVAARGAARVTAPFDGRVVFAGPFRKFGRVLIIEHDGGYHTVLAGFARIDVIRGQWVLAGEPVGMLPERDRSGAGDGKPRLYAELRRDGKPVNPLRWITAESIGNNG